MTLFDCDKSTLMERVLERHGAMVPTRLGWAPLQCINGEAHSHGDKDKSASVNMQHGYYNCHACGLKGDGWDLMFQLEGLDVKQARSALGYEQGTGTGSDSEPTFITWR